MTMDLIWVNFSNVTLSEKMRWYNNVTNAIKVGIWSTKYKPQQIKQHMQEAVSKHIQLKCYNNFQWFSCKQARTIVIVLQVYQRRRLSIH